MPIAVYEFTPDQATDLSAGVGGPGVVDTLEDLSSIVSVTSYVMAGNLYVVVAT